MDFVSIQRGSGPSSPLPWIDIRDFGAVGDGVSDDTAAIQAAIDAAQVGSFIYFPNNIFKITASLSVKKSLTLGGLSMGGQDSGAVIYTEIDDAAVEVDCTLASIYYFVVQNLTIQNGIGGSSSIGVSFVGTNGVLRSTIDRVHFRGNYTGVSVESVSADWLSVTNNIFDSSGGAVTFIGLKFSSQGAGTIFSSNRFIMPTGAWSGIWVTGAGIGDMVISTNHFDAISGTGAKGIFLDHITPYNYGQRFTATGNKIDNCEYPIYLSNVSYSSFIGNVGSGTIQPLVTEISGIGNRYDYGVNGWGFMASNTMAVKHSLPASGSRPSSMLFFSPNNAQVLGQIGLVQRSSEGDHFLGIQTVEDGVSWRDVVFAGDGGNVGVGEKSPTNKLTVGANSDTTNINTRINGKTSTGAAAGTLTNAPTAGNPVGYLSVTINGTERFIPYW